MLPRYFFILFLLLIPGLLSGFLTGTSLNAQEPEEFTIKLKAEPEKIGKTSLVIGTIRQKEISADDLNPSEDSPVINELHKLFLVPVLELYYEMHKETLKPTAEEIEAATEYLQKYLASDQAAQVQHPRFAPLLKVYEEKKEITKQLENENLTPEQRQQLQTEMYEVSIRYSEELLKFAAYRTSQIKLQFHFYDQYGNGRILTQNGDEEAFDGVYRWISDRERRGEFSINDPVLKEIFYSYWTDLSRWEDKPNVTLRGEKNVAEENVFNLATLGLPPLKESPDEMEPEIDSETDYPDLDITGSWIRTNGKTGIQSVVKFTSKQPGFFEFQVDETPSRILQQKGNYFVESQTKQKSSPNPSRIKWTIQNKNFLNLDFQNKGSNSSSHAAPDSLIRLDRKTAERIQRQFQIRVNLKEPEEKTVSEGSRELNRLAGQWLMVLEESGYIRLVEFRQTEENQIRLYGAGLMDGTYEWKDQKLVSVQLKRKSDQKVEWILKNPGLLELLPVVANSNGQISKEPTLMIRWSESLIQNLD